MTVEIRRQAEGLFDIAVGGVVVGCGSMMEYEDGDRYLERIDVDEEHRGRGYGTGALYALRDLYGTYYLAPDNASAQRLYERVGTQVSSSVYDTFGYAIDQGFGVYEV
jgi:ribosomal protein S18 acetylase RimI-like enzyme